MKIFVNPGHAPNGEPDAGACNSETGLRECDVVASIGPLVASYLEKVGYEVQVLQDDSLSSICSAANDWMADLFVSIHCNSAENDLVKGGETYKYYGSVEGGKLANCIQNQLVKSLPIVDRGVKEAGFYVIKNTNMTACLVETAFISNADDEKLLADSATQDKIAGAIARGITDYFALSN
ncbi:N-acetylmuramoyl-L-alanine amidase family protein [Pelorhabdus rhamnosifermentans]|uniref:N-acetylmuramoyl-L-alanine amidase family protein n=1 Tax=Pelorhabdus rhamnosifermentans TaxID=2772457 RepID=UPI001C061302|nr:N-acetylmuramoyl-L-alanine amidase [Pelorhabdus rhamnosifermentans]